MDNKSSLISLFEIRLSQPIRGRFCLVMLEVAGLERVLFQSVWIERERSVGRDIYTLGSQVGSKIKIQSENEQRCNPDFRRTFQGREYSIWATNQ